MISSFNFVSIPQIIFGSGKLSALYDVIPKFGKNVVLVIGEKSLRKSGRWDEITSNLEGRMLKYFPITVSGEPSPKLIDDSVEKLRNQSIDVVVGIGGGSVIDAGKAISAMILKTDSITNYLEGVGNKTHDGNKIPYIAIPTTSGTGSEATKNAVISKIGSDGFKKSLRHDNLIPNIAIIDAELMVTCPPSISATCGMDAFTQLLEAYLSPIGSPLTDSLAFSGMKYINENLLAVCAEGASNIEMRTAIAYGALLSGICLANAGLGIVHGLASSIGGSFDIPHGVVCGTLLSEATKMNIKKLKALGATGELGLEKFAEIGALLEGLNRLKDDNIDEHCDSLIKTLESWTQELKIERLGKYGITLDNINELLEKTGLKNNPVILNKEDIRTVIVNRI
ncbi:MAG: iron-containing alcohol dehydrogenase [Promethearchaeota archaeon]